MQVPRPVMSGVWTEVQASLKSRANSQCLAFVFNELLLKCQEIKNSKLQNIIIDFSQSLATTLFVVNYICAVFF